MTPKIRQTVYLAGTVVSGVLGIALVWGGVDAGTAESLNQIIAGVGVLFGGGTTAVAAKTVREQRKEGTFDAPGPVSPADQIINALPEVVTRATDAISDLERVKRAADEIAGTAAVVVGPLAKQALETILKD